MIRLVCLDMACTRVPDDDAEASDVSLPVS